jgi:hypothetical protein
MPKKKSAARKKALNAYEKAFLEDDLSYLTPRSGVYFGCYRQLVNGKDPLLFGRRSRAELIAEFGEPKKTEKPEPKIEQWMIDYLLEDKYPEVETIESMVFILSSPGEVPIRWGTAEPWWCVWEKVKDSPEVKAWKAENGETHAEKRLTDIAEDRANAARFAKKFARA